VTRDDFKTFYKNLTSEAWSIVELKGGDYAKGEDQFDNFRRGAASLGLTPLQVWAVYWLKHVDAILTVVGGGVPSEPVRGRFIDLINYSALGAALLKEEDGAQ
jgi:hypothetical protein